MTFQFKYKVSTPISTYTYCTDGMELDTLMDLLHDKYKISWKDIKVKVLKNDRHFDSKPDKS